MWPVRPGTKPKAAPPAPVDSLLPSVVVTGAVESRAKRMSDSVSAPAPARPLAVNADAITRSEKARVAGERDVQAQREVVPAGSNLAANAALAAPAARATPAAIAGCYRLQPSELTRAQDSVR